MSLSSDPLSFSIAPAARTKIRSDADLSIRRIPITILCIGGCHFCTVRCGSLASR